MRISVIIVTYNRPDALEVILNSITKQKLVPDEVIIADDGSGTETSGVVANFKKHFPAELKHVWHEDKGFRAAAIRNEAIKVSTGEILIFSDGDLIFHPAFFYDFYHNIKPGKALIGSRVFLNKKFCQHILFKKKFSGISPLFSRHIDKNRLNSVRFPVLSKVASRSGFSNRLRGGLLGVWKKDIIDINGWNEDFVGWGLEDTELVARLSHAGIELVKLKLAGITYHLWHPFEDRSRKTANEKILNQCLSEKTVWTNNGLLKR